MAARIVLEHGSDGVVAPSGLLRGVVEGLSGPCELLLERRASADLINDRVDVIGRAETDGAFALTADAVPSYDGRSIRYLHALVARRGDEELARRPIRVAIPDDATLRVEYFGAAVAPGRGTWTGTIVMSAIGATIGLSLMALAWAEIAGPGSFDVVHLLGGIGGLALLGVAAYMPWGRWLEEKKGWTGPFVGLAPEPSFSAVLTREGDLSRLETMYALRNVTVDDGYRGGARPALELTVELSPRCRDVARLEGRLDVVEVQRVRRERAAESAAALFEDRDTVLASVRAELVPDRDASYLRAGTLPIPVGFPPPSKIEDWGGVEWRFSYDAAMADGTTRTSGARALRVRVE